MTDKRIPLVIQTDVQAAARDCMKDCIRREGFDRYNESGWAYIAADLARSLAENGLLIEPEVVYL